MDKVSIIIPAHNESDSLEQLTSEIITEFDKSEFFNCYEIIIINDGSTDESEKVGKLICEKYKFVNFINLKENITKPYALEVGIEASVGKIIATIDADLQYAPSDLIKMLRLLIEKKGDVVNGYREKRKDPFLIKFFSKIYNLVLVFLSGLKLKDFWCGIKVFKKNIFHLMDFSGLTRFVIFYSYKYNFKILEVSVMHFDRKRGKTSYNFFNRIILALKDMFTLLTCIVLGKSKIYQIKQVILVIYLVILISIIFFKKLFDQIFFDVLITFLFFICLNFIIGLYYNSKSKTNFESKNFIKSIFKSVK